MKGTHSSLVAVFQPRGAQGQDGEALDPKFQTKTYEARKCILRGRAQLRSYTGSKANVEWLKASRCRISWLSS